MIVGGVEEYLGMSTGWECGLGGENIVGHTHRAYLPIISKLYGQPFILFY